MKLNFEKKAYHKFVELVETNPLIHLDTLLFDQYSRLSIHLNIFGFLAKISK